LRREKNSRESNLKYTFENVHRKEAWRVAIGLGLKGGEAGRETAG